MEIRAAQPEDAMEVARVHVRSWQAAYRGMLPDAFLDSLRPDDWAVRYDFSSNDAGTPQTVVLTEEDTVAGFATAGIARDADVPHAGELLALYVDPLCWGRGYGAQLIQAARSRLVARGFRRAILWQLKGNARAEAFYRKDGWAPDGIVKSETMFGILLDEVRFARELVTVGP